MQIDSEYLAATVQNLRSQADQINGALILCDALLKRLAEGEGAMTVDQLQDAIARGAQDGSSGNSTD